MVHATKEEKRNSILKSVIQCSQLGCTHSYSKSNSPRAASALKHNAIDFLDGEREGEGYECQKLEPTNMTYMQCAVAMAKVRTRAGKFGESEAFLPFSEKVTHNYHSFPEPSSMNSNSGNPVCPWGIIIQECSHGPLEQRCNATAKGVYCGEHYAEMASVATWGSGRGRESEGAII